MHQKIFVIFTTLILCVCGYFAQAEQLTLQSGTLLPEERTLHPFTLEREQIDSTGEYKIVPFTQENLRDHWTLLFFGFTHCPWLCPTTMANLANAYATLKQKNVQLPQIVFISVDPGRDTAAQTRKFATTFNPDFIGARTDDQNTLLQLTHETSTMFQKVSLPAGTTQDKDPSSNYTIDHSGDIIVINPEGKLVAMLTMPHTANQIVADYQTILQHAKTEHGFFSDLAALFGK